MTEGDQYERLLSGPVHLGAAEWRQIRRRSSLAVVSSQLLTECKIEKELRRSIQDPEPDDDSDRLGELAARLRNDEDASADEDREAYIFDLKIFALSLKYQQPRATDTESDGEVDKYDVVYGIRQLKAAKRFQNWKNQVEKNAQAEQQKEEEQVDIINEFFEAIDQTVPMRNRITDQKGP
jgi:hypothetical protein